MTKTFTFAVVHFSVALLVGRLLSGSWVIGGLMAMVEPAINTVAFHFHEKVWKRFEQGKLQRAAGVSVAAA